jgi:nicotinate phosphoribosyltransferase
MPLDPPEPDGVESEISRFTDHYFKRTRRAVERYGDATVTYAVFMRRPVLCTPKLMLDWMDRVAKARGVVFDIRVPHAEGDWVGAGDPLVYVTGSFRQLVELETLYLQKLGPPCVAAYNAYSMCADMPNTVFLAMDARHCAGAEMAEMMAYAASVGSKAAQREHNAKGFIGNATDATAHYFGQPSGLGTMPHALIGYAGSTLRAAEMYADTFPGEPMTVLVDYYGREVSDSLEVSRRFPDLAEAGKLSVRLDTHGGRFIEGLDPQSSYAVLERFVPKAVRQYRTHDELQWLVGTGVSAAAIFHTRDQLDGAGFRKVKIVASSGFNAAKCHVMGNVKAPIDVVGTGSYLPENWRETYATADIIAYNGRPSVKLGREFLLKNFRAEGQ